MGLHDLTFNIEGPMMQGTWVNPTTGDTFTVKDSFFQDNQYVVQTTDGRMIGYDRLQNYVQSDSSKEMESIKRQAQSESKNILDDVPDNILAMVDGTGKDDTVSLTPDGDLGMLPEDAALLKGMPLEGTGTIPIPVGNSRLDTHRYTQQSPNYTIIEKALKKTQMFDIDHIVSWSNFPTREIEMLVDVMDIDINEIVDYYVNSLDINAIRDDIAKSIADALGVSRSPIIKTQAPANDITEDASKKEAMKERMAKVRAAKANKAKTNKSNA